MKIAKTRSFITINKTASDDYMVSGALTADVEIAINTNAAYL